MQKDFAEFRERCERLDSGHTTSKWLLKRIRELVAQVHSNNVAPPKTLLFPLVNNVLPVLGDSTAGRKATRLVYLLAGLIIEDAKLRNIGFSDEFKVCKRILESGEHLFHSNEPRRIAAIRLYSMLLELELVRSLGTGVADASPSLRDVLTETTVDVLSGKAVSPSAEASSARNSRLGFLSRRRSSAKNHEALSNNRVGVAGFGLMRSTQFGVDDIALAINGMCSEFIDISRQAFSLLLLHTKNYCNEISSRLLPYIPHCRQPSALKLNMYDTLTKLYWIKICLAVNLSGQCPDSKKHEFYVSMAILLREGEVTVKLASIGAISLVSWRLCKDFEIPAYPAGLSRVNVLQQLLEELLALYKRQELPQPLLYNSLVSVKNLGKERSRHQSKFPASNGDDVVDNNPLGVLWQDIVEICRRPSCQDTKLEAIKALIWIADDDKGGGGKCAGQIKELCLELTSGESMEELLLEMKERVQYNPGLASLLLELAFSRFISDADNSGLSVESIFSICDDCLQSSDSLIKSLVLQKLIMLLDAQSLKHIRAAVFAFIGEELKYLFSVENQMEGDNALVCSDWETSHMKAIVYRLVNAVYFSSWGVRRVCAQVLNDIVGFADEPTSNRIRRLLSSMAQDPGCSKGIYDILLNYDDNEVL